MVSQNSEDNMPHIHMDIHTDIHTGENQFVVFFWE